MNKQKVIVYVDGFNFYYGLKKNPSWKRYYWKYTANKTVTLANWLAMADV